MRIGYVYGFEAFPPTGGNKVHAYHLIRSFQKIGHEVAVLNDASVDGVSTYASTADGSAAFSRTIDVLYVRIDAAPLAHTPWLAELIRGSRVPVVWEINSPANENLAFSWLGGTREPATVVGRALDRARRQAHAWRHVPRIRAEERLRRGLASHVGAAACVSAAMGRYAREHLGIERVSVLPNGSDPERNHPDLEPAALDPRFADHLKVLFAGSPIYPWQGLGLLREAIRLSADAKDPIVFVLLVNQPVPDLAGLPNVVVAERVPYEDVGRYIVAADVCVTLQPEFPWSKWGFHGSPTKMFDYMACGRPLVSSRVGQMATIIEEEACGVTCDYTASDVLAKLRGLALDPDGRRIMGENARRAVVERYNWDWIAQQTVALFDAVRPPAVTVAE